jgi:hypothetical protein
MRQLVKNPPRTAIIAQVFLHPFVTGYMFSVIRYTGWGCTFCDEAAVLTIAVRTSIRYHSTSMLCIAIRLSFYNGSKKKGTGEVRRRVCLYEPISKKKEERMGCLCDKTAALDVIEPKRIPLAPAPKDWSCLICMDEDFHDHLQAASCGHVYHETCIQLWSRQKNECPLCQSRIY